MPHVRSTTIPDLSGLSYNENDALAHEHDVLNHENSVLIHQGLVHKQDEVQIHVCVLEPGGRIMSHYHNKSRDIFFVIEGEFEARHSKHGTSTHCGKHAIHIVPPGTIHEIVNASTTQPLKFLLIQSPSKGFDFIRSNLP
jgi:quercetin dioxygenase-like cupin family protein